MIQSKNRKVPMKSVTHNDYKWPRVVPLSTKPAQPLTRTGVRIYCPQPEETHCKENGDFNGIARGVESSKKRREKDESVLMSREKCMRIHKITKNTFKKNKLKSIYQTDYEKNPLAFEKVIEEAIKKSGDRKSRKTCRVDDAFIDPLPFKLQSTDEYIFDPFFS